MGSLNVTISFDLSSIITSKTIFLIDSGTPIITLSGDRIRFAMDLVEVAPAYDVSDQSSYNGGITSGLGQRLIIEMLAGLSLTKRGLKEGSPVRPHKYRGTGNTYDFGNGSHAEIPKRD